MIDVEIRDLLIRNPRCIGADLGGDGINAAVNYCLIFRGGRAEEREGVLPAAEKAVVDEDLELVD